MREWNFMRISENGLQRIRESKLNDKNPNWLGEEVGYTGIHLWVQRRIARPKNCQKCGKVCKPDLANISQKYKRDLLDWEWLCRRCHMKKDGRSEKLRTIAMFSNRILAIVEVNHSTKLKNI